MLAIWSGECFLLGPGSCLKTHARQTEPSLRKQKKKDFFEKIFSFPFFSLELKLEFTGSEIAGKDKKF